MRDVLDSIYLNYGHGPSDLNYGVGRSDHQIAAYHEYMRASKNGTGAKTTTSGSPRSHSPARITGLGAPKTVRSSR
ncbi:hypothetical protein HFO09_08870 [Rhizobium laguerreae]|nr:hypothetical protein [Rhizobium laguerreae]MBY3255798.1 hypothetical protein [Rhizobium laguerreae]MBY3282837.1 hypothetical protein [Rhizobium laguerreae]MBY3289191.1 hypothetical protein [Rhizobium laguerreae]